MTLGQIGLVAGWGKTSPSSGVSLTLKKTQVRVQPACFCGYTTRLFAYTDEARTICAGAVRPAVSDVCEGDSGGALLAKGNFSSAYYLAGVVSVGRGCIGRGIYTRVAAYERWIRTTIASS